MPCVALLSEDEDWHEATVAEVLDEGRFIVTFDLGNKKQEVAREELVLLDELVGGDAGDEDECPLCGRVMQLTRHHLIPRSTHDHFKKHPHHAVSDLFVDVYLCRQCHRQQLLQGLTLS